MTLSDNIRGAVAPTLPLAAGRECGGCVVCCEVLPVDDREFQKPGGVLCKHCSSKGCGIYATRPAVCREWFCGWRRVAELPDELRPDRSGILIMDYQQNPAPSLLHKHYLVAIALRSRDAFLEPPFQKALVHFRKNRVPLWLASSDGAMNLAHPTLEVALALFGQEPPATPEVAHEAELWRGIYEPL